MILMNLFVKLTIRDADVENRLVGIAGRERERDELRE